jgi:hypothetical protein
LADILGVQNPQVVAIMQWPLENRPEILASHFTPFQVAHLLMQRCREDDMAIDDVHIRMTEIIDYSKQE